MPAHVTFRQATLKYDLTSGGSGTSTSVTLQTGPGYGWCQFTWGYQNPSTSATVEIELTSGLSCTIEDLKDVRGIFVWFSPGTFHVDHIRAE
ncbi:hypothetical protein [Sphaerisporangium perillae]|uniref:hypothetical protein n=1 Tax=Sphaerisporangium perillae TaxID=2935860 RepID=UPI0020105738|nr:hypothetical protein [Sphaerisporangium perillae]